MCTNSFTRASVKKRVLIITLCVQKTERVTRNLCSVAPQHHAPDGVAGRRSRGAVDREDCASKGSSIAKPASTRCYLTPLRIEGSLFLTRLHAWLLRPDFCRLGTRKPLLHSSLVACRPPPRRSRNPAHARKRSPPCKSCLKTCLRSLRFRVLKTVRDQSWWAA
jgi:hypothetical protein